MSNNKQNENNNAKHQFSNTGPLTHAQRVAIANTMSNNKQYIIVDLISQEFFKDVNGNVKMFDNYDDALLHCGIYELENAWVCELKHNHIEEQ